MRKLLSTSLMLFLLFFAVAQDTIRQLPAVKSTLAIKIDGKLDDEAWISAPLITNLVEMRPSFARIEDESHITKAYLLYDDDAIYFGGVCREPHRDSIATELIGRDNIGVNDFIGLILDTYQDKINGLGFYVTPLGEQFDIKYSLGDEDAGWSSVYQTATAITSSGWVFEMRIPYSAIRFSKEKVQNWNFNIIRRRVKTGQQFSWSPVDPKKFGFINQSGTWTNIKNIKSPIRLSFSPYFSAYLISNPNTPGNKWTSPINGGMDVKYGISKAFTLDMTLVPDFGQVQSDNQVLNLTPFEVRYNENRSFFTEGTELFNKGNFFYSRRVGGVPLHYGDAYNRIGAMDSILKNPAETKLINATKISGRTPGKLGIGFFNAVTKTTYATAEDANKQQYQIETNPLTNYNVLVLDQALKYNSSVTLVNTNVWRSGTDYDANVLAILYDIYDKNVNWNVWGKVANSRLVHVDSSGKVVSGYHYHINLGKFKGRFNFDIHQFVADNKYDQNDMGYFTNNNYIERGFWAGYKWLTPKGIYNNLYLNLRGNYSQLLTPRKYQYLNLFGNINGQLKNLWTVGFFGSVEAQQQDFYEPRVPGKMVKLPGNWRASLFFNTNRAKKFTTGGEFAYSSSPKYKGKMSSWNAYGNYRFNDKLSFGLNATLEFANRNLGYGYITSGDSVVFGLRDRRTVTNIFNIKYNFNNKMGITFRARHYWSKVEYVRFFQLKTDGYLDDISITSQNPDNNANFFNIDMIYTWQFAPGSFINVSWKTAGEQFDKLVKENYYRNLRTTLGNPQQNNFSVKIIYFLDYLMLKELKKPAI